MEMLGHRTSLENGNIFYLDSVEEFCIANDIERGTQKKGKYKANFLSAIEEDSFAPQKLISKSDAEIKYSLRNISNQNTLWWQKVTILIMTNKRKVNPFLISLCVSRTCRLCVNLEHFWKEI